MAVDMEAVRLQQRELNMVSDEIHSINHKLKCHQETLMDAWKSQERNGIDQALDGIVYRMNRLSQDLVDLGHDVIAVGEELQQEESTQPEKTAQTN